MGLALVTAPTVEPVTLTEVKAHCRVSGSTDDTILTNYLLAARHYAENYTRRAISPQTWDYTIDYGWPPAENFAQRIYLPMNPVASITSVKYVDATGTTQTLNSGTDYFSRIGSDRIGFVEACYGIIWPIPRYQSDAVTVRFVAGYNTSPQLIPEPIRIAIMIHTEMLYDRDPAAKAALEATRDLLLDPYCIKRL